MTRLSSIAGVCLIVGASASWLGAAPQAPAGPVFENGQAQIVPAFNEPASWNGEL